MKTLLTIFVIGIIICAVAAIFQAFTGVENAIWIWIGIFIFLYLTRNMSILK